MRSWCVRLDFHSVLANPGLHLFRYAPLLPSFESRNARVRLRLHRPHLDRPAYSNVPDRCEHPGSIFNQPNYERYDGFHPIVLSGPVSSLTQNVRLDSMLEPPNMSPEDRNTTPASTAYGRETIKSLAREEKAETETRTTSPQHDLVLKTFRILVADLCQQFKGGHPGYV